MRERLLGQRVDQPAALLGLGRGGCSGKSRNLIMRSRGWHQARYGSRQVHQPCQRHPPSRTICLPVIGQRTRVGSGRRPHRRPPADRPAAAQTGHLPRSRLVARPSPACSTTPVTTSGKARRRPGSGHIQADEHVIQFQDLAGPKPWWSINNVHPTVRTTLLWVRPDPTNTHLVAWVARCPYWLESPGPPQPLRRSPCGVIAGQRLGTRARCGSVRGALLGGSTVSRCPDTGATG